ncbi:MAG: condensation domain-containing protein [Cyanobacteriota bacterium]|nr:condensation domain-containing protein [Cyanobacteriota bacterium]
MKILNELLSELRDLDIQLWLEGDRLRYNAPKGALTPELRDRLVDRKAEIISFLQQTDLQRANATVPTPTLPLQPVSRENSLPLSFAQERIWFLEYLGGKSGSYNMPLVQRLTGNLDVEVFKKAIGAMVARHEILRTTFKRVRHSAVQVIHPTLNLEIPVIDIQQEPEKLDSIVTEEIQHPFNLETGPLLRVRLLHLAPQEYIFLLVTHHIISDAWSEGVFIKELSRLYSSLLAAESSPLPELPIQYADFASWQRQWLQGEILETQLNYWKEQLGGKVPALELPCDRPNASGNRGAHQYCTIPSELTQALKTRSQQERSSLFIVLLAAFKALLNRYTSQEDILVCFPIAGRNHTATEGLIGYFNNILPARTDLSGNPSVRTLIARVRQTIFAASKHQDVPFQKIGEFPHLVRTALTRAMFALQNTPSRSIDIPSIEAQFVEASNGKADFDLYFILEEKGDRLAGTLNYNADRFESISIANFLKNYQTILECFAADLDRNLEALPQPKGKPWDSLVPLKPKGNKRPLFLVHDGLGRSMLYLNLARHLHPDRPVYALRPYGNEENPVFHRRVVEMATHYNSRIRSIQPEGPYSIGGLSFGGTIAMEMACQLEAQGQKVDFLALIDSLQIEELRRIGARTFTPDLIQQNQAIHEMLPELIREYSPQAYEGKVTLFRGSHGEGVDRPNIDRTEDPLFGWEKWVGEIEGYDVPGGHYSLLQEPNVQVLAQKIEVCLEHW